MQLKLKENHVQYSHIGLDKLAGSCDSEVIGHDELHYDVHNCCSSYKCYNCCKSFSDWPKSKLRLAGDERSK